MGIIIKSLVFVALFLVLRLVIGKAINAIANRGADDGTP